MIVNQWVPAAHKGDAIGDSARRVQGLLRAMGHESELYALTVDDDLRGVVRPFSRRRRAPRRRHDLPLRAALSDDARPSRRCRGGRVLQYHNITPAHFFAPLRRRPVPPGDDRAARARHAGRPHGPRARRLGVQPPGAGGAGVRETPASCRSPWTPRASRGARAGRRSNGSWTTGWPTSCSSAGSRRTRRSRITSGWPSSTSGTSNVDYRFIFVGKCDALPRYYAAIRALDPPRTTCRPTGSSSRAPCPTRTWRPTTGWRPRLHLAQRARGLLRPAARGDGRGRPGARLRGGGRARHAGRRRRAVLSQGPRVRGRAAGHARLRRTASGGRCWPASGSGCRTSATRASGATWRTSSSGSAAVRTCETRLHRPTLRDRDPRRLGVPLPPHRRAAGAAPPGGGADHLRARLHHVEERVPGRRRPGPRRDGAPLPERADARHRVVQPYSDWIFATRTPATTRWSGCKQQGPWCPALVEYLQRHQASYDALIFFTYLYAPTVLGLQVAPARRASWCRRPTTSRRSASSIYREVFGLPGGHRLQHRGRAAVPDDAASRCARWRRRRWGAAWISRSTTPTPARRRSRRRRPAPPSRANRRQRPPRRKGDPTGRARGPT